MDSLIKKKSPPHTWLKNGIETQISYCLTLNYFTFLKPSFAQPFRCCALFFSFPHTKHTPTLWINTIGLFIAQSHDRKHIVPYLLGLVACSACIIASFWVEAAAQPLWMNESPPEAGRWHWSHCDVTPETRSKEGALWDLPFIGLCLSLPLCAQPLFSCPVMGSYFRLVTHPPAPLT